MLGRLSIAIVVSAWCVSSCWADDWPAYRHDARRSNTTEENLRFPLRLQWRYQCPQPPEPAFPESLRVINRTDFDYAPQPVVAGGIVCFGSSSDDTVRALDAATGRERWHFISGGPVRLPPQIASGRVYFGSDDGHVYCLDAATGRPVWTFRAAPHDERLVGNHRMISRWPVRSGVLVDDAVAYCVAGMWPTEGIYIYALDAATGKVKWCNDTSGALGVFLVDSLVGNHQGEFGAFGLFAHGALLASNEVLVVPSGNGLPMAFDKHNGQARHWNGVGAAGAGGGWVTLEQDRMHVFAMHREDRLSVTSFSLAKQQPDGFFRTPLPQLTRLPSTKADKIHDAGKVSAVVHLGKLIGRRAYDLVLAGGTLIEGQEDAVRAIDAGTQNELWRADVHGHARGIAVANGRLFATTNQGQISCFAMADIDKPILHDVAAQLRQASSAPTGQTAKVIERAKAAGMDRGHALVVGDERGEFSVALAMHTALRIVNVQTSPEAAAALREHLLANTTLLGTRIHVHVVERLDRLPFAQYFANAVVVAGPKLDALAATELYRVLRPCGGILLAPGLGAEPGRKFLQATGVPAAEIQADDGLLAIVRGKLPGALDWNSKDIAADQRVKWPLRPLWFGGPSVAQTQLWREGYQRAPIFANGRYFVQGEDTLTAVDAYNGSVLWSRPLPRMSVEWADIDGVLHELADVTRNKIDHGRSYLVDEDHVYVTLEKGFHRGKAPIIIQLDARTGRQQRIFGDVVAAPAIALKEAKTWPLEIDADHAGAVTLEPAADRLIIKLTTKDPALTPLDVWDLCFDFRPYDERYGLYDRGAFRVRVNPRRGSMPPTVQPLNDLPLPELSVSGTSTSGATETVMQLSWKEVQKLIGASPRSFGFAATLTSHDGAVKERPIQRYLFGDASADGINNGWTNFVLGENVESKERPAAIAGSAFPKDIVRTAGKWPKNIDDTVAAVPRLHPLTGEEGLRYFRSGNWGCGQPDFSATTVFRRAGGAVLGIQDFEDDSGLRSFPGIKAGCSTPRFTAMGLMILSEESGHCVCNHFFRTSLAFAPAERRLEEDFALFYERDADTLLRQAAVNLGAFGDRRDENGELWLGYPRPGNLGRGYSLTPGKIHAETAPGVWLRHEPACLQLPLAIDLFGGESAHQLDEDVFHIGREMTIWVPNRGHKPFGPYRVNADNITIQGTDRPWIYASGYRGIRQATLQVDFLRPVMSTACADKPEIDGQLNEASWSDKPQALLPATKTEMFFRHDDKNLYVAARRPAVIDRKGHVAWAKKTSGEDAEVWKDDSLELFLSDAAGQRVVHLGVSASGARFDAFTDADKPEDRRWNATWRSAMKADDSHLICELAIPWTTLAAAGLDRQRLAANFQMNQSDVAADARKYVGAEGRNWDVVQSSAEAFVSLGNAGRERCANFTPLGLGATPPGTKRSFTVRLHFAELDDVEPGQRVFDVKLQGQVVLKDFDVVKEAKGPRRAIVKELRHIEVSKDLTLEFVPAAKALTQKTAPILSGLAVFDESFSLGSAPTNPR